jgi:hypothetical protein
MPKTPTKGSYRVKTVFIDTKPTAYNTRFRKNALFQVADTINANGLPLLLSHDSNKLPSGQWYEAVVKEADEELVGKFFIPKEIKEYEDVKTRIDTGILDSVSIGFNAGKHDCSICGNNIYDYENCSHIPGRKYEIKNPQTGNIVKEETCYVLLDDINVSEGSLVYSGAVKNAKIIESSDKKDFFKVNNFNFAEGNIEVVHTAKLQQDKHENNDKGLQMPEATLADLQDKYSTLRSENLDLKDKIIGYREEASEYKEKATKYDALQEELTASKESVTAEKENYAKLFSAFAEKVETLAAPFKTDYKAPEDLEALLADLDKYINEAKALPSGRQSKQGEDEVEYHMPAEAFAV